MENALKFLDDNKTAVMQEMAKCITLMNNIMGAIVETEDNESGEISKNKMLFQMFHSLGALTILYNQFTYLETGEIPEDDEKLIGFQAILNSDKEKK
jgi:hypothetical protein